MPHATRQYYGWFRGLKDVRNFMIGVIVVRLVSPHPLGRLDRSDHKERKIRRAEDEGAVQGGTSPAPSEAWPSRSTPPYAARPAALRSPAVAEGNNKNAQKVLSRPMGESTWFV